MTIKLNHTDPSQYRGVNVLPRTFYREGGSIEELHLLGVNLVRLHIIENDHGTVQQGINAAMRIIIDALNRGSQIRFLWNLRLECQCDYREHLRWWQKIVPMVDGLDNVLGYDIVNEPWDADREMRGWRGALPVFHQAMRDMTDKIIMVQSGYWGSDSGFKDLAPFGDANTWYGCNIYTDERFTHQGLHNRPTGMTYPGDYNTIEQEKANLIRFMDTWPDAKIFVPEVGIVKYADDDSAAAWIDDTIGFLESRGIGWCWHCYAHPNDLFVPREPLKYYWGLNDVRKG